MKSKIQAVKVALLRRDDFISKYNIEVVLIGMP